MLTKGIEGHHINNGLDQFCHDLVQHSALSLILEQIGAQKLQYLRHTNDRPGPFQELRNCNLAVDERVDSRHIPQKPSPPPFWID